MDVGGNFFALIQLDSMKDTIKEAVIDLSVCGLRAANNLHRNFNLFEQSFVKTLKEINMKVRSLKIGKEIKLSMATTIKNMINELKSKHLLVPVLKRKSESTPKLQNQSPVVIPDWKVLPSLVFVKKLEQFELPINDCVHKDVLTQFSPEDRKLFLSFFENVIDKVLDEADDFFELIKSPTIKEIIGDEVKQLKIHVLRIANHNHSVFNVFKSELF